MSQRSFGSDIGNTSLMTAADSSLIKSPNSLENATEQMEKPENGHAASTRLPRPLAIEIYTKIHNSTFSKDDLLDEIEDLVDEKYYPGEILMSQGKEYTVVTSEKRGGLTLYTMEDGTKIGHRDLRRKKGLSLEEIQQATLEDVIHENEKVWKVKDALLKECPIRETKKFAPIFSSANRKAQAATSSASTVIQEEDKKSDGEEEEEEQEIGLNTPLRVRPSGGPAASASRRQMEKKKEKEAKEKEKLEKKEKEKEEKLRKKEEEKAKKQAEKDDKLKKKAEKAVRKSIGGGALGSQGLIDRFVKKAEENGADSTTSSGQPSKWSEKRVALGLKKVDEAWKRRDQEAFNEACIWCEKNLSGNQRATFENPIYKFAIQKLVDKTKDKALIRGWKRAQQVEYRHEMAEKRRAVYSQYEPQIKAWFNEDIALDDLLVTSTTLDFPTNAKRLDCDAELLKCMEIAQYFVSMRKILLWNENISAEQLRDDLHQGLEGFRRSTYKMIANLLETALQEKEFEKVAHCNARLSEFPITEHTVSELIHAFFIGNTETSFKRDAKKQNRMAGYVMEEDSEESEHEEEAENEPKSEEKDPENGQNGPQIDPKPEENDPEDVEDSEEVIRRQRILAMFQNPAHIYEWAPAEQLEVLYELKELVHDLPIIREWYLRDANTEQLTGLKAAANKIAKKIEDFQQQLADLPPGGITEAMSRHQTREMEKVIKKRQNLEKALDDLRDELEENREKSARERDDLERIYRVISIGNDRHLRKYYWFAYSSDAGIWVQDFGTTSYEKWVRDCREKGFMDIESLDVENRPEYEDLPITSSECTEVWYKLDTESDVKELLQSLAKNGKREKPLKKYLSNNLDDILSSIRKPVKKEDVKKVTPEDVVTTDSESMEDEQLGDETAEEEAPVVSKFQGPFGSLKQTMMDFLRDYQQSGITKIGDLQVFEGRLLDANNLDEMKRLFIELVTSIPKECLIEKYKMDVALVKSEFPGILGVPGSIPAVASQFFTFSIFGFFTFCHISRLSNLGKSLKTPNFLPECFSHLIIPRFCRRVEEAKNPSCLHMLLAYFDARIDRQRTLPELPCQVCRRKNGTQRKLMCKQCATVFHYNCHRPAISPALFEEEGFKERWWCAKCTKEDRRRQLEEARAKTEENRGSGDESAGSDEEEEDVDMLDEEEQMSRGRSAKRKANAAMRDVLEFEGVLRAPTQPPAPKKVKKDVVLEDQKQIETLFLGVPDSIPAVPSKFFAFSIFRIFVKIKFLSHFRVISSQFLLQKPVNFVPKLIFSCFQEVQELFDSIERANPRLYKLIQTVPSQSRSTRNSTHECRSLMEIEEDLDVYTSADQLHDHLTQFFQHARGWVETHNSRKLDDLDDLISELNFV
ncbi:Protein CBG13933 [Caenorhabditis briggsae]|uniref:Protein CBG13933 n=1 Tax=Caenorhabditis briggsae TaxID=6238 RepID=A8XJ02_CAEBR|nr:Protein CBG13933 [Caenorhabditis briggsae]CAP32629.2 Protein CBG13933 [Caenorhabditis briggsae]